MKPTDVLRSEHETIVDVLSGLETVGQHAANGSGLDLPSAQGALEFLRGFADRCHHGKEEQLFFPALVGRGLPRDVGPLAVMLHEHDEGRALLSAMADAVAHASPSKSGAAERFGEAAVAYVALMREHIAKENGVLFPMADGLLSAADQAALLERFEHFEHADMGPDAHARLLGIADDLCERLGVDRAVTEPATHTGCCGHGGGCH